MARVRPGGGRRSAGVALELEAPGPVCVTAAPDHLRQVVGNALRATPAGGGVTLALTRRREPAVVEVRHTGRGKVPSDR
ncbi:ATP-binding protein [Streptomyces sp. NPDC044984]|uniref:ATP-binding protein n=1 Tax=Streptomyces sp. NPDC044984 TaxID=3154335 RepID=UPI0034009803